MLFGATVDIRRGDFLIYAPPYISLTSLGADTIMRGVALTHLAF